MVTIDDRGPGIPAEMRDMVREPFLRLERSRARTTGGSGLGLAIVSNLVARHEGHFNVSDAPGGGARMSVDLPQFRAEPDTLTATHPASGHARMRYQARSAATRNGAIAQQHRRWPDGALKSQIISPLQPFRSSAVHGDWPSRLPDRHVSVAHRHEGGSGSKLQRPDSEDYNHSPLDSGRRRI